MKYADLFRALHPDFFSSPHIRAIAPDRVLFEQVLDLHAFSPEALEISVPESITFGLTKVLDQHGVGIIVCDNNENPSREIRNLSLLRQLNVNGIIIAPISENETYNISAEVITFTGNQTYAVYSAPNKKSIRGANGKARVSTNGWIQVFGYEDDWILVQYDITDKHNRIGYIYKNALPRDVEVPELKLKKAAAIVNYNVEVTDDPLVSQTPLAKLTENTRVTCLGTMGTWAYIEAEEKGVLFRGFVPTECLSGTVTTLREANQAIIGSWKLYAGSSINASRIVFNEDGTMTGWSTLESGQEVEWTGTWSIDYYDTNRNRYWNDSEFELTLASGPSVELYGLRICRQSIENGKYKYALVLSDGAKTSGMVFE